MCMIVTQLDEGSDLYTLCFAANGEFQPISDFDNPFHAYLLQKKINSTGYGITLKPTENREFAIGQFQNGDFREKWSADCLTAALDVLDIKVDFEVEAPEHEFEFELY